MRREHTFGIGVTGIHTVFFDTIFLCAHCVQDLHVAQERVLGECRYVVYAASYDNGTRQCALLLRRCQKARKKQGSKQRGR